MCEAEYACDEGQYLADKATYEADAAAEQQQTDLVPIMECAQPPVIRENLQDLRAMIDSISAELEDTPKDKTHLAKVKKRRTEVRKKFESLDKQRKAVKAEIMAPYEKAMAVYKELIQNPITQLDAKLAAYISSVESEIKAACEQALRQYFAEACQRKGIRWLEYEQLQIKVDLTLANQKTPKKAMDYIDSEIDRIYGDLETISTMVDMNAIMGYYTKSLNLKTAIDAINQHREQEANAERVRQEMEQSRQQQAAHRQQIVEQAPEITQVVIQAEQPQEEILETGFAVRGTLNQLKALKAFLVANKYNFNALEVN